MTWSKSVCQAPAAAGSRSASISSSGSLRVCGAKRRALAGSGGRARARSSREHALGVLVVDRDPLELEEAQRVLRLDERHLDRRVEVALVLAVDVRGQAQAGVGAEPREAVVERRELLERRRELGRLQFGDAPAVALAERAGALEQRRGSRRAPRPRRRTAGRDPSGRLRWWSWSSGSSPDTVACEPIATDPGTSAPAGDAARPR